MKLSLFVETESTLELEDIIDKELVKDIQFHLDRAGYSLTIDGIVGDRTLTAWAKFKKDHYLNDPDKIGSASARLLLNAPQILKGYFKPTDGIGWVSSPYGQRSMGFHKGIDIACNEGTPIHAVADGVVSAAIAGCRVGNFKCGGGYGNVVYVDHNRLPFDQTCYAHLSRLAAGIEIGRVVNKGNILGYCGNTGHSFGNHLHFETRVKGTAKNPIHFINPIV
ncbi:MAG: M23 family metallopeptidase [Xenococcaceae cyanobacterium]